MTDQQNAKCENYSRFKPTEKEERDIRRLAEEKRRPFCVHLHVKIETEASFETFFL